MSKINKVKSQMSKINKVKCQMSKINKVKCQMSKINKVNFDGSYLRSSYGHFLNCCDGNICAKGVENKVYEAFVWYISIIQQNSARKSVVIVVTGISEWSPTWLVACSVMTTSPNSQNAPNCIRWIVAGLQNQERYATPWYTIFRNDKIPRCTKL